MKFSHRTHPILEKISNGKMGEIKCFSSDMGWISERRSIIREAFCLLSSQVQSNIFVVSRSFVEAFNAARKKLFEANLWADIPDASVCYILNKQTECGHEATTLTIHNDTDERLIVCQTMTLLGETLVAFNYFKLNYSIPEKLRISYTGHTSANITEYKMHILQYIVMILFIKYAKIETKYLPANNKLKDINCKYVNDTKLPLTILDSTWFTTLVKSDAFKVRGHFRLQPKKKDGEWTKELIWINEFQKEGYTRKAGMLDQTV